MLLEKIRPAQTYNSVSFAGSDLDGDEYIVIWDESLFFPGFNREPMVYGQKLPQQRSDLNLVITVVMYMLFLRRSLVCGAVSRETFQLHRDVNALKKC